MEKADLNLIEIKNLMEDAVRIDILSVMNQMEMCTCDKCVMDVLTRTLNSLPPRYVARTAGGVFASVDIMSEQGQAEILTAIVRASELVRAKPFH